MITSQDRERLLSLDQRKTRPRLEFPELQPKDFVYWEMIRGFRLLRMTTVFLSLMYGTSTVPLAKL